MLTHVLVKRYDAFGGPVRRGTGGDGFPTGPTDAGTYRVSHCGRHSSHRYKSWSTFRWGSAVKQENGKVLVMHDGRWSDVQIVGLTPEMIEAYHRLLYGTRQVPQSWV